MSTLSNHLASKIGLPITIAGLLLSLATSSAHAATFVVINTSDGAHPGPPGSLRSALNAANVQAGADTIEFDPVAFSVPQTITLSGPTLAVTGSGLTINGPGADKLTISGNNAKRVLHVDPGMNVILNDLTIADGNAGTGDGGGIHTQGLLTMNRCAIRNSLANQAAGLASFDGTLFMNDCEISGNVAALYGGGISIIAIGASSTATLTNVTVSGNSANSNESAGGVDVFTVSGATFVTLVNCTVARNTNQPNSAGGVYSGGLGGTCQVIMKNTIVDENTGLQLVQNQSSSIISNGANLIGDSSFANPLSSDVINQPAMLGPLAMNGGKTRTHALQWGSPAIDKGHLSSSPATDQRGRMRPVAAICGGVAKKDIGAFEMQRFTVSTLSDDGPGSLRWAVEDNNLDGGGHICITAQGTINCSGGQLVLSRDVTISGPGADRLTLDGLNASRLLFVDTGVHAVIDGLAFEHGREAINAGGAIQIEGGSADIRNCAILNSLANQGGGILNSDGILTMRNCEISGNSAMTYGGGVMSISQESSTETILINTTISGNSVGVVGPRGAGILAFSGAESQQVLLINCTVTSNVAPVGSVASGLISWDSSGLGCEVLLKNTIVSGNSGQQAASIALGRISSLGNNICSDASCNLILLTDHPDTDPLLAPLANNGGPTYTHAIAANSPAVDNGNPFGATETDQTGADRTRGCTIDIGAVELQSGGPGSGDFDGNGPGASDTAIFVEKLLEPDGVHLCIADMNDDGRVDGQDVQEFVYAVFGS